MMGADDTILGERVDLILTVLRYIVWGASGRSRADQETLITEDTAEMAQPYKKLKISGGLGHIFCSEF